MNKAINIIIAGGKTGGHLFPGIAIAQALELMIKKICQGKAYHGPANILFVGTNAKFETQTLKQYGFAHKAIFSKPIKGGNVISKLFSASIIIISLLQSMIIIKNFKPDFILGVGGFSSFAVILTAWIFGIPNAIQEQNAFPGMTNRMLSKFTKTIFTSFKDTKGFIDNPKVKFFGNPVRKTASIKTHENLSIKNHVPENSIHGNHGPDNYNPETYDPDNYDPGKFTILVTGGSQGAASINNAFMDALELMNPLMSQDNHISDQFNIVHQTGVNDEADVKKRYKNLKINATARAFFHDMPKLQDMADLVITRAGAGIISELSIKGLPAILIPFPHAADDHQTFNAKALEEQGAAVIIQDKDLTGDSLKTGMENLIANKEKLKNMGKTLQHLAMPDADVKIASYILKTVNIKKG